MMKLPHSRRARVIAVILLAVCAAVLCKPFGWLGYLARGTPFVVITWILPRFFPTLAAFVAGPVGAVIVSLGAVYPRFFTYKPYHEMFTFNIFLTVSAFFAFSVFSAEFYIFAKRGGRKNWVLGLLCGTLDHFFVGMLCNILAFRTIDKTTTIQILPFIVVSFAALAAHTLAFLLRRKEKTAEGE